MTTMMRRRAEFAASIIALAAWVVGASACQSGPAVDPLPILPIGGDFTLTDHDGLPFTLASQRGRVVLVFFGYSSCPDACPTTLSKLATVSRRLGDDGARVRTLYVSVDPERDTPPVLKADLANFALDAVGLTGTKGELDRVVKQYAAAYEIVPTLESAAKYTVSHTTTVYAVDAQGQVRLTFAYEASVDEIVRGIRRIIADSA